MNRSFIARCLVLIAWATFFVYLWSTGEMTRYLGPRTYWVVPFGALTLAGAALVHVFTLRAGRTPSPLSRSDLAGLAALLVPVAAVAMIPSADLGALAASRKSISGVGAAAAISPPEPQSGRAPSFIDIHFANESADYAARVGIAEGIALELTGFVSKTPSEGTFELTRFYVSCCAADALPYSVTVTADDSGSIEVNQWLHVDGTITETPEGYRLEANSIEPLEPPDDPYLY